MTSTHNHPNQNSVRLPNNAALTIQAGNARRHSSCLSNTAAAGTNSARAQIHVKPVHHSAAPRRQFSHAPLPDLASTSATTRDPVRRANRLPVQLYRMAQLDKSGPLISSFRLYKVSTLFSRTLILVTQIWGFGWIPWKLKRLQFWDRMDLQQRLSLFKKV